MNMLDQLRQTFREHLRIKIENRSTSRPDITAVESAVAIGHIFDADTERQKFQHELDMRGGPRISTNDANLGRDQCSLVDIPWLNSIKAGRK
jgi:hypothetical protein